MGDAAGQPPPTAPAAQPSAAQPSPAACTVSPRAAKRVGMVIALKPECVDEYKRVHAGPGVRDLLERWHLRNFSIYLHCIAGTWYEFATYDYTGSDLAADMAGLSAEPRNAAWLKVCDPMQQPLPGATSWTEMEEVYYNH